MTARLFPVSIGARLVLPIPGGPMITVGGAGSDSRLAVPGRGLELSLPVGVHRRMGSLQVEAHRRM